MEVYSNISTDGLSRPSRPQEQKERPTVARLRCCTGTKQIRVCSIGELILFLIRTSRNVRTRAGARTRKNKRNNEKSDLFP